MLNWKMLSNKDPLAPRPLPSHPEPSSPFQYTVTHLLGYLYPDLLFTICLVSKVSCCCSYLCLFTVIILVCRISHPSSPANLGCPHTRICGRILLLFFLAQKALELEKSKHGVYVSCAVLSKYHSEIILLFCIFQGCKTDLEHPSIKIYKPIRITRALSTGRLSTLFSA